MSGSDRTPWSRRKFLTGGAAAGTVGLSGLGALSAGAEPPSETSRVRLIKAPGTCVTHPPDEAMRLFAEGKIDAFMGFPPEPQDLRARGIGRVIVNTTTDRPWSDQFCCTLTGNQEFVRAHPVATKRVLRAVLKAADICAAEPARVARLLVDRGYTPRYDLALQTVKELPYTRWRELDPEGTLRFFALRLHDAGIVKASPNRILAQGMDWRFLHELRRELKG